MCLYQRYLQPAPHTTPRSAILFTSTAADDGAGNTGHSITRTVTVGQPNIIHFTSLNIASSSSDNFARATQSITVSLVTDGSELGNFTGTILGKQFTSATNGGSASFTIEATLMIHMKMPHFQLH